MTGYIEMPNDPSFVINNEKSKKDFEPDSWYNNYVDSGDNISLIPKKGHPGLLLFLVWII